MFVNTSDHYTLTAGLSEQKAFGVEMNAMLFRSVIDGIYADKVRAPMREIATNARDAMFEAGKGDQPFDIQLPSHLRPVLAVRDYGKSLTHEQVMGIYSTMFSSTKRATNDAVGMIGLGSKSPFANTNSFNVRAFLGGTVRLYNCFIGSDDVPQVALITEAETDEPDGVEVSWTVKRHDIDTFRSAAPTVLFGFHPKPNILNETFVWDKPVAQFEGEGWWLYDADKVPFEGAMARQGCVLYPLNFQSAGMEAYPLANYSLVVDFPIGQLSVTTSRDALGYDNRTKENIRERMAKAYDDMTTMVQAEVDAHDTLLDACAWLEDVVSHNYPKRDLYVMLMHSMKWQGHQLRSGFALPMMATDCRSAVFNPELMELGVVRQSVAHRCCPGNYGLRASQLKKAVVLVEFEGCKKAPSRVRRFLAEMTERVHVIWVKAKNEAAFEAIHEQFGLVNWTDLSDIEPLEAPERGRNPKQTLHYVQPIRSWGKRRFADNNNGRDIPDPDEGDILYVEQDGTCFRDQNGGWGQSLAGIHDRTLQAIKAGMLSPGTRVYFVPTKKIELVGLLGMKELHEVIREAVIERLKATDLTYYEGNPFATYLTTAKTLKKLPNLPTDLSDWCDRIVEHTAPGATSEVSSELNFLFKIYAKQELTDALAGTTNKETNAADIKAKYPLVFFVLDNTSYYNDNTKHLSHAMELYSK